jgi:hypothetical protein
MSYACSTCFFKIVRCELDPTPTQLTPPQLMPGVTRAEMPAAPCMPGVSGVPAVASFPGVHVVCGVLGAPAVFGVLDVPGAWLSCGWCA